jgi:3-keto-disaccharide hydrolase
MNKSKFIFKSASLLGLLAYGIFAYSQEWKPELTEKWEPVPPKVTPGEGTAAPSDAIILFDGKDLSKWQSEKGGPAQWKIENGCVTIVPGTGSIQTKQSFGDVQLHIEWRAPLNPKGDGQDHGNSGVYLQKRYEIQVLDCYTNKTYVNGQTASVYKQYAPLVNACKPTGEWQTYDIIFMAPRFNENGSLFAPGTITLLHNGILVLNNVKLQGPTEYIGLPKYIAHDLKQPLLLQDHDNPVSFRNIWVREL